MSIKINKVLGNLPEVLRAELVSALNSINSNYRERRWEPSELNGGKLCEIVFTILRGHVNDVFEPTPSKPKNFVDGCREFEKANASQFSRSIRIQIPRMMIALYEIRNN